MKLENTKIELYRYRERECQHENQTKDLYEYLEGICEPDCTTTYMKQYDPECLLAIIDEPGRWEELDTGMSFIRHDTVTMVLLKVENNKCITKGVCYMDRSKYQTDFDYVTNCRKLLLRAVRSKERKERE